MFMKSFCCKMDVQTVQEPIEKKQKFTEDTRVLHGEDSKDVQIMNDIKKCANIIVEHNIISKDEANKQVSAIHDFYNGKMSYAEMRAIAG